MYPNLYFALYDIFGIDVPFLKLINSFGLMVALAFVAASMILSRELRRKEEEGLLTPETRSIIVGKPATTLEIIGNGLLGFIFGYKFVYLILNAGTIFQGGGLPQKHIFSGAGSPFWGIVLGGAFAFWRWYEGKKNALPKPETKSITFHKYEYTGSITMYAAFFGILGAKLFHLFENPREFVAFFSNPSLEAFLGGLTIYGGLIVGALGVWWYARKINIPFIHLADATAPGLMLAYGIGRMGCQISGDGDWGIPNTNPKPEWLSWLPDWAWAYNYPNNVNAVYGVSPDGYVGKKILESDPWPIFEGYGTYLDPGVYPTPLYEIIMALIIFAVLWSVRKRIKVPGVLFGLYMTLNGLERFWIEKIRVNSTYKLLGFEITQAEIISTLMFFGGIALMVYLIRKNRNEQSSTQGAGSAG
ncbi:MAG: hypothetical protein RL226_2326 [Bacteroidota bacterium]